jgi:UDP-arabinose 4-epimerase
VRVSTVLVTGGAGYIGSHVCKALAAAGHTPVAFDNLSQGHLWAVRWGPLVEGDIRDRDAILSALRGYKADAVVHLAACSYVGESMLEPERYWDNNVIGSRVLLEAMREDGPLLLIFSSTCATYGLPKAVPVTEETPQIPISTYGATKLAVEHMITDYARCYGFKQAVFRYFNAAGADPDAEIGEAHDPETHLIPNILEVARGGRGHVDVFGADYETPDGTCVRDYVHVSDIADAHVLALGALLHGDAGIVCNLGSSVGYSVMDIVKAARKVTGASVPHRVTARRPGDPPIVTADAAFAERRLGWRRRHSDLETIISTAWSWSQALHSTRTRPTARQA